MRVIGLDEREYNLKLVDKKRARSSLHEKALEVIKVVFPSDQVVNEISLPGCNNRIIKSLYADIMIPKRRLIIEVHGSQHFKHSTFFHKSKREFYEAQARDNRKREWCVKNNFTLLELAYNNQDEWEKIIRSYFEETE